jgi:hypothetical protein
VGSSLGKVKKDMDSAGVLDLPNFAFQKINWSNVIPSNPYKKKSDYAYAWV